MNLAIKDIRHNLMRFLLTAFGVGLLIATTIGMLGMYRGIVFEAVILMDDMNADLWVVEGGRVGPFAESSAIPVNLDMRVEGVPGVALARRFIAYNQQFQFEDRYVRLAVTALDFPKDNGNWIPLIAGRTILAPHYEAVADISAGFNIGDKLRFNRDLYTVVGLMKHQVDMAGDPLFFVTIQDAQTINRMLPSEAVLLNRASRGQSRMGLGNTPSVGAVLVTIQSGINANIVREKIARWGDVNVLSNEEQHLLLLDGRLGRLRIQIMAFATMTLLICCAVIALTIYTMTLEKTPQIALLKLIGARDRVIVSMIVTQSVLIGLLGLVIGIFIALNLFPHFPRIVLITFVDVVSVALALIILSIFASWFSIQKALNVRAQAILS